MPTYTVPLLSWPQGLRIVVSSGLTHGANALVQKFWDLACDKEIIGVIQVLLHFKAEVSLPTWYEVNFSWHLVIQWHGCNPSVMLKSGERVAWMEVLHALSMKLQSDTTKTCALRDIRRAWDVLTPYCTDT